MAQFRITYRTEDGGLLQDTVECTSIDDARVTALDELPGCCEIDDIEEA